VSDHRKVSTWLSLQCPSVSPDDAGQWVTWADASRLERDLSIRESFRLEKTLKIIESNRKPNTAKSTTKPCTKRHIYTTVKYIQGW